MENSPRFVNAKVSAADPAMLEVKTRDGETKFIPADESNGDYRDLIASGIEIAPAA